MRICFVVGAPRRQRATYTTMHLVYEALAAGHDVGVAGTDGLSVDASGAVLAQVVVPDARGRVSDVSDATARVASPDAEFEKWDLEQCDVVMLRANPAHSIEAEKAQTVLDFARVLKRRGVLVLNDPDGLVRARSKMYLEGFPAEIRPRTLVTRSSDRVLQFLRELDGPAIIKPLAGFGGQNVFYIARGQSMNVPQMVAAVRREGYVIVQEYLPDVARGDMRVLLVGGEVVRHGSEVAAYRRMRPRDDIRNNMHVGGMRKRAKWSDAAERICAAVRTQVVSDGLYLVGLDIVGDKLLEINVHAPGGIHNIQALTPIRVATHVIAELARWVDARRGRKIA